MDRKENEIIIRINIKTISILVIIFVMIIAGGSFWLIKRSMTSGKIKGSSIVMIEKASAAEIYPQFVCTCCGRPLDKNNICCGIAEDMIAYIDSRVDDGLSEDDVILVTTKKYGLKSLALETKKQEVKNQLAQQAPADSPKISIEPLSYDFGNVSQVAGVVSQSFVVQNTGKSDLKINNLLTSCGCTSAALVVDGQEGPRFGMHNNPKNWSAVIKPGENADLKVYYDPEVHPDFRGLATREVTVFSNDPVDFEKSIKIKLNQID